MLVPASNSAGSFIVDDFRLGEQGESWIIESVRIWMSTPGFPGDTLTSLALFGGLVDHSTDESSKGVPDCDCHSLVRLSAVELGHDLKSSSLPGIVLTQVLEDHWQIDFHGLRWIVPGGTDIQFGVHGSPRQNSSAQRLAYIAAEGSDTGHLRSFSADGKFVSRLAERTERISVQVKARLLANVRIQQRTKDLQVTLKATPAFQASEVDTASLRFGPASVAPMRASLQAGEDGRQDLILTVPRKSIDGINGPASICLVGKRIDGVLFEGCDLINQ